MSSHQGSFSRSVANWGAALSVFVLMAVQAQAVTYYVDSVAGNNANAGTSTNTPWQTLGKVNATTFVAGDRILFKAGGVWLPSGGGLSFVGNLHPRGSGAAGNPIVIDMYGIGPKPLIAMGATTGNGAVYLANQQYWEINNLEITSDAATDGDRRGVYIKASTSGTYNHIYIRNCYIHNIRGLAGASDGDLTAKRTGGIVVEATSTSARYNDILIENNTIDTVVNQGIVACINGDGGSTLNNYYPGTAPWEDLKCTSVVIRGNVISGVYKNAMIIRNTDETGLVEYNVCHNTATGTTGNTMFTSSCRGTVFQYNEGYANQAGDHDGSMYDADLRSPGIVFQYSYSHDNTHGLYWTFPNGSSEPNSNVVVRYNISQNDRGDIFAFSGTGSGSSTHIYNNTVYISSTNPPPTNPPQKIFEDRAGGHTYYVYNNIFHVLNPTATYSFGSSTRTFDYNVFYGQHPASEPSDAHQLTSDPLLVAPGTGGIGRNTVDGYKLQPGSPCIDSGITVANNGGQDYFGNPVPSNTTTDRGAHEFPHDWLAVTLPAAATEGAGVLTGQGLVTIVPLPTNDVTVALVSSNTTEVTVPASVTILAGQTNAPFDVTIGDDAVLDGSQTALVTATATGYASGSATIIVHDNETATLSLALASTAAEGSGSVAAAVFVSAPVATNVAVTLTSSDATEVTAPSTVTIPAGQTNVAFNLTIVNDTQIDGPQTATITAHVVNWTDGSAAIVVVDNENTNLTVSLPASAYEGDGVLTNAGHISISGTWPSDLLVSLTSDSPGKILVPATVTIPAGQISATFNVTIVDNALHDGTQIATVTASTTGFVDGSTSIAVKDNELYQLGMSNIASPQSAGTPFVVSMMALDVNGSTITVYQTAINLTASGDGGSDSVQPTTITAWTNGVWTGAVRVNTIDTNVRLTADDEAGHTVLSNPFNVQLGPLDHFGWNIVPSPQHQDIPFPVNVTAQDAGNNTITGFTGAVALSGLTNGITTNTILGNFSGYWSGSGDYTLGYSFTPNANLTVTHVRHFFGTRVSIWTDSGSLLVAQTVTSTQDTWVETALTTPVQLLSNSTYRVGAYTGGGAYRAGSDGGSDFPNGTINEDYWSPGTAFPTRVLSWPRWWFVDLRYTVDASGPVAVTPTNSGNFVSGVWTGAVTVLQATTNVLLRADDGSGHSGTSTVFNVLVPTPFMQWQFNYFGCTDCPQAQGNADPYGKGIDNASQFLLGLNPTNSTSVFRVLSAVRESNDVVINWATAGVRTNAVQATNGDASGGYSNNFADISGPIDISTSGDTTTNWVDVGGATNGPSRYYRIRLVP